MLPPAYRVQHDEHTTLPSKEEDRVIGSNNSDTINAGAHKTRDSILPDIPEALIDELSVPSKEAERKPRATNISDLSTNEEHEVKPIGPPDDLPVFNDLPIALGVKEEPIAAEPDQERTLMTLQSFNKSSLFVLFFCIGIISIR